ncbi:DNA-binding protein [Cryobacterium sp. BB736]|uniref:DNA-binding protein n=1 Tax=Cryobacterium sp. BB736 TaxID=2746963 RepID=UPI001876E402|nr:DNA-binding protein [Cryobacterium sp. BB736]
MFVITADQVDSRSTRDLVGEVVADLNKRLKKQLTLAADRTAGDELQLLVDRAETALDVVLQLTRSGRWSVGCGVGAVAEPLPRSIRETTGDAFVAARAAVDRAKRRQTRFALEGTHGSAPDAEALIDLLLVLRSRRSDEGWEIVDLVSAGMTQAAAAKQLGITPQAASKRALAAELRAEQAAIPALTRLLDNLGLAASNP